MERFTKPVPEGRVCLWYKAGDLNRKPLLALVTDDEQDGILKLAVLGPNWAHHICYSGVRHKDDPHIKQRPQGAKDNGVWDYLPGPRTALTDEEIHAFRTPSLARKSCQHYEPLPPASDEVKKQITELFDNGKSATEVAEALTETTGEKWSYQRVNTTLRLMKQPE